MPPQPTRLRAYSTYQAVQLLGSTSQYEHMEPGKGCQYLYLVQSFFKLKAKVEHSKCPLLVMLFGIQIGKLEAGLYDLAFSCN